MSEEVKERTIDQIKSEHANVAHRLGNLEYQTEIMKAERGQLLQALQKLNLEAAELQKKTKEEEPAKAVEGEVV